MTKEVYYEMCEALNSEPIDSEIPVEFEDLHLDVQEAFIIYNTLQDNWDTMNGGYLGKNFAGILDVLELFEVDDRKVTFQLIRKLDEYRSKALAARRASHTAIEDMKKKTSEEYVPEM